MDYYKKITDYYDKVIAQSVPKTVEVISKFLPSKGKLLDVGCGTGRISEYFSRCGYEITAIDNSESMFAIARKRLKGSRVILSNLIDFETKDKFDIILCLYDTVNHLLGFNKWKIFFSKYSHFLSQKGVLIFDINTLEKLKIY